MFVVFVRNRLSFVVESSRVGLSTTEQNTNETSSEYAEAQAEAEGAAVTLLGRRWCANRFSFGRTQIESR